MKRALAVVMVPFLVWACGGESTNQAPPASAADAPSADAPAADGAGSDKPAAKSEDEGAWAGEAEAKADKAPADAGQAETRSMDVIAKLVADNRKPVRDCMDKVQKQLPELAGKMTIHFFIDPEGKVTKAELNVERSEVKNPEVVDCAIKTITGLKFPPSSRQMQSEVNYPYDFKKRQ